MTTMRFGFVLLNTALAAAATGVAALAFWPVYQSAQFVAMLAVTVAVGAVIALLGALLRLPSIVVIALLVVAYLAFGVPLAVPAEATGILPSGRGLADLVAATALSWKELVTISLPVGSYQALLVPPFLLVLVGVTISLSIALRARRSEAAVIPPAVVFVAGILLGPDATALPFWLPLALLGITLAWLIGFRWQRRSTAIRALSEQTGVSLETARERRFTALRTLAGAAVIVVVAGGAGLAATTLLPPHVSRQVVRSAVEQPFDPRAYTSPLSGFRKYLQSPDASRAMLEVSGLPADHRIRIATLDTYDGVVYAVGSDTVSSASGSFTRVPYRLAQAGVPGSADSISVTVRGYTGVWVPGSGQLQQIEFSGSDADALTGSFFYNDTTGTAAVTHGLRNGDQYRIDAVTKPLFTATRLMDAVPGTAQVPKPAVVPDELTQTVQRYSATAATPGAKLAAVLAGLAHDGYLSHGIGPSEPASRSGHGADRITQLLTDIPMLGDQEQYSVTAALMARQLGFPARVVVGFRAPADSVTGGEVTLTGADISAWIEVQTRSNGWVTVDPTPPVRPVPPRQPQSPTQISRPQTIVQPPVVENPGQLDQAPQAQVDNNPNTDNPVLAVILLVLSIIGWSLLALAIIASPFLAVIGAKWRRRVLRRSAITSIERITGGWREFADTAVDFGYEPPPAATRSEVARSVGSTRAVALASVADRAVFSPVAPTRAESDQVWTAVDELRRSLAAKRTRWQRLVALVSLHSFGVYRGRRDTSKRGRP